jgi:DNA polymerase-3 subunit epsilon
MHRAADSLDQTHWAAAQQRRPLPTFYYHAHFVEMLDFVATHYGHAMFDAQQAFIDRFRDLSRHAQCLYVRLVNRKGRVFARNGLRYPELDDIGALIEELRDGGFVGAPGTRHFADLLRFLTRAEIYATLLPRFTGMSRSLKKVQLVEFVHEHLGPDEFVAACNTQRLLVQRRSDEVQFLLFLYFGRVSENLSRFTMRDLGIVRAQGNGETYEPRFEDRDQAFEHYYFARSLSDCRASRGDDWQRLALDPAAWPRANYAGSAALRDELAAQLGRKAERAGDLACALDLYKAGESAECNERLIRLLFKQGRREEARAWLQRCLDNPRSDEEWLIANDLYARKFGGKRTSPLTDAMRSAETIDVDESRSGAPERAVIEYFEKQGVPAFRSENLIWRELFGLLFWEELFDNSVSASHSPFELLPASLAAGTFHETCAAQIEAKLALLTEPAAARRQLLRTITGNHGTPNGVFRWRQSMTDALFPLLDHAPARALQTVLRRFCSDYANARYGYPDLLVIDADGVRFVEVKTEGDQLRRNQYLRLEQLQDAGLRADVLRVRWVLDPRQVYVVVDVETTGGRGEQHRVTEIGAVKVRNGQVVDRFQTLLNPQRSIPPGISRLTGITPAMVADAPAFADIADEFAAFLDGAIFVAHNVEFDYGFVSREYARLGKPFRHPKLCTCASMRRLYPGHRSYSLAALCRQFDIPLRQHHRALCDAEAAAELLLLVNERRPVQ